MKLKPCPFCGNDSPEFDQAAGKDSFYAGEISTVFCKCGAEVTRMIEHKYDRRMNWENQKNSLHRQSRDLDREVAKAWNKRS